MDLAVALRILCIFLRHLTRQVLNLVVHFGCSMLVLDLLVATFQISVSLLLPNVLVFSLRPCEALLDACQLPSVLNLTFLVHLDA